MGSEVVGSEAVGGVEFGLRTDVDGSVVEEPVGASFVTVGKPVGITVCGVVLSELVICIGSPDIDGDTFGEIDGVTGDETDGDVSPTVSPSMSPSMSASTSPSMSPSFLPLTVVAAGAGTQK